MQAHRQVVMWTTVILALSLILLNRLREPPVKTDLLTSEHQSDLTQIDLATLFESKLVNTSEKLRAASPHDNQHKILTTAEHGARLQSDSPHSNRATAPMRVYYVRENDTLWRIARKHNLDLVTLLSVNKPENPNLIRVGQAIKIPSQRGTVVTVQTGDTLENIALRYGVPLQSVVDANGLTDANAIQAGTELFIPAAKIPPSFRRASLGR
ncbi:MAG: LysM peptidoglycan-binding domain-containing protein [Candidatus Poribacteria bacterium]|nr:LysM peptidoglycan-binding domain-containing protein [Candidatus Poribacteria bacterium]